MKVVHVFLLLLFFNSCAKSGQYSCLNSNMENLMLDTYWQIDTTFYDQSNKGYTAIYHAVTDFDNMKTGFRLNQDHTSDVMNVIGFCGTPPYGLSNGKWECDGNRKVIHTFISGCIANYEDKMEIISVSDDQLEVYHSSE